MACLLIAGTIILSEKIKGKNKMKREKKRQAYEDRYSELEEEHKRGQLEYTRSRESGGDTNTEKTAHSDHDAERSSSRASTHSRLSSDGPAQWIEETNKHRSVAKDNKSS